jgi:hypothetical protein
MRDIGAVGQRLRALLEEQAVSLFDHMLALIEQDLAEGWRVFYAREVWLKEWLPPPP